VVDCTAACSCCGWSRSGERRGVEGGGNVVGDSVGRSGAAGGGDCVIEFVTGYNDVVRGDAVEGGAG
jgi:hypothetical protein